MRNALFASICVLGVMSYPNEGIAFPGSTAVGRNDPLTRQIVLLRVKRPAGGSVCAGISYAPNVIVTAAHCLTIAPANIERLPAPERRAAYASATEVRVADVKVFYRHTGVWQQPKELRLDRNHDVAVMVMPSSPPAGYQTAAFDDRGPREIVDQLRDATFVYVGHDRVGARSTGEVHRLNAKATRLMVRPGTDQVIIDAAGHVGGCNGNSGGPVYVDDGNDGIKLLGMLQGGGTLKARFVIAGTHGKCSHVMFFTPIVRVREWVETLMADARRP